MTYSVKNFDHLLGTPGFSDQLLRNHFALYKGYVDNTNKLIDELSKLLKEGQTSSVFHAELKRRFGWELNGIKLHELYFENMTRNGSSRFIKEGALAGQMAADFGSTEAWEKSFRAVGSMRGIGWALLCYDGEQQSLYNVWVNEHDRNYPARTTPILIMDVWEHAFMLDYGVKRDGYIEAFMKAIDWKQVNNRFEAAAREPSLV